MNINTPPRFTFHLIKPQYWLIWGGFGLLAIIVNIFPFSILQKIGAIIGLVASKVSPRRFSIAKKNLGLAFPHMSEKQKQIFLDENIKNTGFAILETGMAWFWPAWRVLRHTSIKNPNQLLVIEDHKIGVLITCCHFLHLEMTARIFGLFAPGYGVYRPHNNAAYNFIQYWGRTRNGHKMVDRKNVREMIHLLKQGKRVWYLPDHDYGFNHSVFVPFFGVEKAATVTGASFLMNKTNCAVIAASSIRHGSIYTLELETDISSELKKQDPHQVATTINKTIEKLILKDMTQWMWVHRRFKTMPDNKNVGYHYRN